jgi:hypothetical protein
VTGSGRGLDWLNFFVSAVQTGFGVFETVYLVKKQLAATGDRIGADHRHDEQPVQPDPRQGRTWQCKAWPVR